MRHRLILHRILQLTTPPCIEGALELIVALQLTHTDETRNVLECTRKYSIVGKVYQPTVVDVLADLLPGVDNATAEALNMLEDRPVFAESLATLGSRIFYVGNDGMVLVEALKAAGASQLRTHVPANDVIPESLFSI
jgi:hypothetical protein